LAAELRAAWKRTVFTSALIRRRWCRKRLRARRHHHAREVLGGKFLYAIQIHITGESYNLCPADICQNTRGEEWTRSACPVDAPKSGMKVEGYEPPQQVIEDVEKNRGACRVEVGGIEYVIDDRTGRQLYTT